MAIKELIILPDPLLREISTPVERVDDDLKILVADMFETMYDAPGIGLAAVQIGVPRRVVVVDLAKGESEPDPMVFINPQIVRQSEEISIVEEGCLSIPDYLAEVERPASVVVEYQDLSGERIEIEADEMLATCLQHEIDHLDGKLFIDHISRLKRNMVVRKFTKNARAKATL